MEEGDKWNGLNCWDNAGAMAYGRAVDAVGWGARSYSGRYDPPRPPCPPHVLFLAHAFEEVPSVKDHAKLMYPRGVWGCARRYDAMDF